MSEDVLISSSEFHIHVFDTQMRRRGQRGRWEVSCKGSDFVPFPVRKLGEFVHTMAARVCEQLVKDSVDKHVVVSDQVAAHLHAAGVINLRDTQVIDGKLWIRHAQFGDYDVAVRIVPANKPSPELAFGWAVMGPRHLSVAV